MEKSVNVADGIAAAGTSGPWLTRYESELARGLLDTRVSFVAEVATDAAAIRRSRNEYGFLAAQMSRQTIDRNRLVSWYPALTLVLLVDSATRCESLDRLWPQFFADLGCAEDPEFASVLTSATPDLLRHFGLMDITELDADFSSILAGQSAIPTLHTTELVELAERYLEMGPITDEYHFAQWLAEFDAAGRSEPGRAVQRFARYGGRRARDVLDGVVNLVGGSDRAPGDSSSAPESAGLPARPAAFAARPAPPPPSSPAGFRRTHRASRTAENACAALSAAGPHNAGTPGCRSGARRLLRHRDRPAHRSVPVARRTSDRAAESPGPGRFGHPLEALRGSNGARVRHSIGSIRR